MSSFIDDFKEAQSVLEAFITNEANFTLLQEAGDLMVSAIKNGHKIITCGNGGSMADAMHFAEELTGKFRGNRPSIPAISISDPTHLSCVANDYGFDSIFSRFIEGVGQQGDVLLAISTSGNSTNCINAVEASIAKGMKIVGLTGKTGGKMAEICSIELRAPHMGFSDRIQEIHIKIIHSLINYIEKNLYD